ncbi:hypothetical protein C4588_04715 [Candidatus Parcubacteria bacterium]|nr:MAG: hypothetical protein C4588_04715 [Candidatus Parcubacteria bacterium]
MPCRFDEPPSYFDSKALDELTKENCELRKHLLDLWANSEALTSNQDCKWWQKFKAFIDIQSVKQLNHRLKDKERAIAAIKTTLAQKESDVRHIKKLGGVPTETLTHSIEKLVLSLKELEESDCMSTTLY